MSSTVPQFLRTIVIVSATIVLTLSTRTLASQCSTSKQIISCGRFASKEECYKRNCCWDISMWFFGGWCHVRNDGFIYFNPETTRFRCGHPGILEADCLSRGCFWSPSPIAPSCSYANTNIDPDLCGEERDPCGTVGIGKDECELLGCCFQPLPFLELGPWCFQVQEPFSEQLIVDEPEIAPEIGEEEPELIPGGAEEPSISAKEPAPTIPRGAEEPSILAKEPWPMIPGGAEEPSIPAKEPWPTIPGWKEEFVESPTPSEDSISDIEGFIVNEFRENKFAWLDLLDEEQIEKLDSKKTKK